MDDEKYLEKLKRHITTLDGFINDEVIKLKRSNNPLRVEDYDDYLRLIKRRNILTNKCIGLMKKMLMTSELDLKPKSNQY
ncbi:hypothetical protein [Mucilaginibacter phyllosphaerae]